MIEFDDLTVSTIRSGKGDCIHLRYNNHNLIIDSGSMSAAGEFRKMCNSILANTEELNALLITHYDEDHIGGILKVGDMGFKEIYFNAYEGVEDTANLSATQNQRLFHILPRTKVIPSVLAGNVFYIGGARITIYSPTEESLSKAMRMMEEADVQLAGTNDWMYSLDELMGRDYPVSDSSISNQASIVLTFEYDNHRLLFCGDAWASNIPGGKYDLVKLPHHGSIRNISDELLSRIDTGKFLICADGTSHPNKQTIAKLLRHYEAVTIYSNYSWWMNGLIRPDDQKYLADKKLSFSLV